MISGLRAALFSIAGMTAVMTHSARAAAQETQPPAPVPAQGPALSLDDCVHLAVTRNERARISDLQVVVAEAGVETARAKFLPVIALSGTDTQSATANGGGPGGASPPLNVGNAALTINQPLLNASAFPLYSQSKRLLDAQRAQNVDDKRLLEFTAATAFFAVVNADDNLKAAQYQLKLAQDNLTDTTARAKGGFNSTNDVTRAQVDLATTARQVEINKGLLDNAYV